MNTLYMQVAPDEDFPQVVEVRKTGDDFKMECVEYAQRWKFDPRRMAAIVDRQAWEEIRASLKQLANDYIVLHMFAEKLLWCIDPKLLDGELGDKARELGVIK